MSRIHKRKRDVIYRRLISLKILRTDTDDTVFVKRYERYVSF